MRTFFERLSPAYTPPEVARLGESRVMRERILHTMLLALSGFGLLALLYTVRNAYFAGEWDTIAIYTIMYLLLVATTVMRSWPYVARSLFTIALMFGMALSQTLVPGQVGQLALYLVGFVALSALFYDMRYMAAAAAISVVVISLTFLYGGPNSTIANPVPLQVEGSGWFTTIIDFLMVAFTTSGAASLIIAQYEKTLVKYRETSQDLAYERETIEDRIQERTRSVSRRLAQLRTTTDIIRGMAPLMDPEELSRQVVENIREKYDLYYVGLFLVDTTGQSAVLRAGTGEAGRKMLAERHQLPVSGTSMIGWSISNQKPRIALDVGVDAVRFSNPNLPLTRSELSLPLIVSRPGAMKAIGALSIQSSKPKAFDENDINLLQLIAENLAIALDNDRSFNETRSSLEEIRALNREYLQRSWAESIEAYGDLSYAYNDPSAEEETGATRIDLPLLLRDETIGHLQLESDRAALTAEEIAFIENITNQTAIALENARLLQDTERRAIQEQKLNELTSRFSRAMSIDEILRSAAQELGQLPAVSDVSVRLSPVESLLKDAGHGGGNAHSHSSNGSGKEPTA